MVNKATLIGHVGKDPEIRTMQNGSKVASFSLATSESWKEKSTGERKSKSQWHNIVIFNEGLIKLTESYIKKGSKLYLSGQIETRKWTDQATGQDKYTTEIVLKQFRGEITMLDSRDEQGANTAQTAKPQAQVEEPLDGMDDEIPFSVA